MTTRSDHAISAEEITTSDSTVHTPPFRALFIGGGGIQTTQERDNWRDSVIASMGLKRRPDEPI